MLRDEVVGVKRVEVMGSATKVIISYQGLRDRG